MRVNLKLEPELKDEYADIHAAKLTRQIETAAKILESNACNVITGRRDKKIFVLDPQNITCFYCEGQNVIAKTKDGSYTVKARLYELEKQLCGTPFVRISSSALANADKIESLEMNFNGTMRVQFKDGSCEYISRRYVSKFKAYLGI